MPFQLLKCLFSYPSNDWMIISGIDISFRDIFCRWYYTLVQSSQYLISLFFNRTYKKMRSNLSSWCNENSMILSHTKTSRFLPRNYRLLLSMMKWDWRNSVSNWLNISCCYTSFRSVLLKLLKRIIEDTIHSDEHRLIFNEGQKV